MKKNNGKRKKKNHRVKRGANDRNDKIESHAVPLAHPHLAFSVPANAAEAVRPKIQWAEGFRNCRKKFLIWTRRLAPTFTIVGVVSTAAWAYWPAVTIDAEPAQQSRSPVDTLFRITNSGRLDVHDLIVGCRILTQSTSRDGLQVIGNITNTPDGRGRTGQWISTLRPGQPVTTDCGARFGISTGLAHPATIDVEVLFHWPYLGRAVIQPRRFISEIDRGGRVSIRPVERPRDALTMNDLLKGSLSKLKEITQSSDQVTQ